MLLKYFNNSKQFNQVILLGVTFFILDIFFKILSIKKIIPYYLNKNIAFSISFFSNNKIILNIVIIIILLIIIYLIIKNYKKNNLLFFSFFIICLGATSNLIDRFFLGAIIDYINYYFFAFNLADVLIVCGSILIIGDIFKNSKKYKKIK